MAYESQRLTLGCLELTDPFEDILRPADFDGAFPPLLDKIHPSFHRMVKNDTESTHRGSPIFEALPGAIRADTVKCFTRVLYGDRKGYSAKTWGVKVDDLLQRCMAKHAFHIVCGGDMDSKGA